MDITSRIKKIQMLLLDVDGVLTSGEIIYSDSGEETKIFDVKDGVGIRMLREAGLLVGIITGRKGAALRHRCQNLGIETVFEGVRDKAKLLDRIVSQNKVPLNALAFIGDDLPDLAIMKKVGLAVAVADAHELIRQNAHLITRARGGRGAVREICETILKAQGKWEALIKRLFHG